MHRHDATPVSRSAFLGRGAALAGAALLASASPAGAASLADPPDGDLTYLRLLVGGELLAADFGARALASGRLGARETALLRQVAADERAHLTGLSNLVLAAGQTPATAEDIEFSYPRRTFATTAAILTQAETIERLLLGAYLGAVENVQTPGLRLPLAQIGANEAQHAVALAALAGRRKVIGPAFAPSLPIAAVSDALDSYES